MNIVLTLSIYIIYPERSLTMIHVVPTETGKNKEADKMDVDVGRSQRPGSVRRVEEVDYNTRRPSLAGSDICFGKLTHARNLLTFFSASRHEEEDID